MPLLNNNSSPEQQDFMLKWYQVRRFVKKRFGKRPDLNAILFLIGINELGQVKENFTKEEKEDLMHIAICRLFEKDGYFKFAGLDAEGWPHFDPVKEVPKGGLRDQEDLLKSRIIRYFQQAGLIEQ